MEGGWVGGWERESGEGENLTMGGIILYNCVDLQKSVIAGVAQLVERNLAKVEVAGSNPVSRSTGFPYCHLRRSILEPALSP